MKHRLAILSTTAFVIAASYVLSPPYLTRYRTTDPVLVAGGIGASSLPEIDRLITSFEKQVPTSSALDFLARLHLMEGRITGEAGAYERAATAVSRSLAMAPGDTEGRSILASVRFTSHEFAAARAIAEQIVVDDPTQFEALAVVSDASAELGDYTTAGRTLGQLRTKVPGSSAVTVRLSRMAFLHGDARAAVALAKTATRQALGAGVFGPNLAFYHSFEGQLAYDQGRYSDAKHAYELALEAAPSDRVASIGLARTLAAGGKTNEAITLYTEVTNRYPDPVALAALGDLQMLHGDPLAATNSYGLVQATATLAQFNRQLYNRQLVLFYANHGHRLNEAVDLARAELASRKDLYGYDALA